jgi:hypothetical protein
MASVFWDRKGVLMVEFMQHVRSVLWNAKSCVGPFRTKAWNSDIRCSAPPWQCAFAYSCLHLSTTGAFNLGAVWPLFVQPWSCSERLPPVYLPEELNGITAFQQ